MINPSSPITCLEAYVGKIMVLNESKTVWTDLSFKELERQGLDREVLIKMQERGVLRFSNCKLILELLMQLESLAKGHANLFIRGNFYSSPHRTPDYLHDLIRDEKWPFDERLFDELATLKKTDPEKLGITVDFDEIIPPKKPSVWHHINYIFDPTDFFRFDLDIDFRKVKNLVREYALAFQQGKMEDGEHFSYSVQRKRTLEYLKQKIDGGLDSSSVLMVPADVWQEKEVARARPLATILSIEEEGLVEIKALFDCNKNYSSTPGLVNWQTRLLQIKVSITKKALIEMKAKVKQKTSPGKEEDGFLKLKKINWDGSSILYTDELGKCGQIDFSDARSTTKQGQKNMQTKLLTYLWDNRREHKKERGKEGELLSIHNLKTVSESKSEAGVLQIIKRINQKFRDYTLQIQIRRIGKRFRLEIQKA